MSDNLNRVFLWCVPRTVSTALTKCLSFVEGLQVVNEPYESAFRSGPESKTINLDNPLIKRMGELIDHDTPCDEEIRGFDESVCTYSFIRDDLLEASDKEIKIIFCKDMAYYLDANYHMLPKGFKYSFLIRHPAKVVLSCKQLIQKVFGESYTPEMVDLRKVPDCIFPVGCGFKELYDLVEYVEKNLDQEAVIIDSDDLLSDPPGILSAYCLKMGIPYKPELLSWEAGGAVSEKWIVSKAMVIANRSIGYFDKAFQSTGFQSLEPTPAIQSLPADVQACVRASMGYYEKLHEKRIKCSSNS